MLTQEYLKSILDYNPETGVFTWLVNRGSIRIGHLAGCFDSKGYLIIKIDQRNYKGHRLVWLYMNGKWPENDIDHIDRNSGNNKWSNLREATRSQNNVNSGKVIGELPKWVRKSSKNTYQAVISINGKLKHLGNFYCPTKAHLVAKSKMKELYGEYVKD